MIRALIDWSFWNRGLVFLLTALAMIIGAMSLFRTPLDAIPDLTDPQVILHVSWMGRSPDLMEEQVTYPITSRLVSAPGVKTVRGYSMFGNAFVYVIFEEGTDLYWARSRVLEYLAQVQKDLPPEAEVTLGPDATGLGWVYQYALVDTTGRWSLADLRTFQDWYLRYTLQAVPGVSEVASVGGLVKEYQVIVDPAKLAAHGIAVRDLMRAVRMANRDVGGRNFEWEGREVIIRGLGYVRTLEDIENTVVGWGRDGRPVYVKDVAHVQFGPAPRRGVTDLNGQGDVVGGVVVMRQGENALRVIRRVKEKLQEIQSMLPEGVKVVTTYDRSELIHKAIGVLLRALVEESVIVSLVAIVFLWSVRSALVAIFLLPVAILFSFIPMAGMKITANIMSLGGIAIALGAMVDAAVVMIENAHKRIEEAQNRKGGRLTYGERLQAIHQATVEVGRPLFFSLLVITVSFLPVFALEAQEGRLFKPLAFTKTFSMLFAAVLSVTLAPALLSILISPEVAPEHKNPVNRILYRLYAPLARRVLSRPWRVVLGAVVVLLATLPIARRIGSEFMPPLEEGSILYMPTTLPGLSVTEARRIIQFQDSILMTFPEVKLVFAKAGRAETATDPAPLSMIETVILLKDPKEWRKGMTFEKLVEEMDSVLKVPGFPNIWTMPIKNRIDMVTTGIRTPVGVKIYGPSVETLQVLANQVEMHTKMLPEVRSVVAQRVLDNLYLDIRPDRQKLGLYGLRLEDVNQVVEMALGGLMGLPIYKGRERYRMIVRLPRDLRDDVESIRNIPITLPGKPGSWIPLAEVADIQLRKGPNLVLSEDAVPVVFVFVDVKTDDLGGFVRRLRAMLNERLDLPPGYRISFSGQYEYMARANKRLATILPLTLAVVFLLLFLNFGRMLPTLAVMLTLPFSLVGGIWLLWALKYNFSVAVGVGVIALLGVAAEIGVILWMFMDRYREEWEAEGRLKTLEDLKEAVFAGAVERLRPVMMTVMALLLGLLPLMWGHGPGASIMKRIAAPMFGGILSTAFLTLFVLPAVYYLIHARRLRHMVAREREA